MSSRRNLDLTSGPVLSRLLQFVIPILLSSLLSHFYNVADRIVVGQFAANGKLALAAVGAAGPACSLLVTLLSGISLGSNIVCANLRGAKKQEDLAETMHTSVLLSLLVGGTLCILGLLFSKPLLLLMGTPESTLDMSVLYMRIYFCGIPFAMAYNFGAGILRAFGDSRRPMVILALSGLVNVLLNLVLVLLCHMDVAGVALATAAAQVVSSILVLRILFHPNDEYGLHRDQLHITKSHAAAIIRTGMPCSVNGLVFSLSNVLVQSSVNQLGDTVLAGNVAAGGITELLYLVLASFYSGCVSFTSQCRGAKKYHRIDQMLLTSCVTCIGILTVCSLIVTLFPEPLLAIFNRDPDVIAAGIPKLLITSWTYLLYSISEIFLGTLRGLGKGNIPTLINVFCICGSRLVWIYAIYHPLLTPGVTNLFLCYPISYLLNIPSLGLYLLHCRRQMDKQERALESV